jgi:carbamoyltransferase
MYILGISAYYHDSSAALIKDGTLISAFEEERFTRKKHDNSFPVNAIKQCLKQHNLKITDISYISYYEKPLLKFERIIETFVATYPFSVLPFIKSIPEWFGDKIKIEDVIRKKLQYKGKILFIPHHLSHSASTFYPSPYKKSAILTIDGVGEYETTVLWKGNETEIKKLASLDFPHSLGLLYSTFTAFLGFQINNDEYKMMGLSAYGKPKYKNLIYKVINTKADGSFNLNPEYFAFRESFQMWSYKFEQLFGNPRKKNEPFSQKHKDIAASIQRVSVEIYMKILNHLYSLTKTENLCISGGVALNSLANGLIYKQTQFKNVYIFGPAGDSAAAVGAALYTYHSILNKKNRSVISHLYYGNSYSDNYVEKLLKGNKISYKKMTDDELIETTAKLLSQDKIIGWFQGKMEFGPRALGNRSILANPKDKRMKEKVNIVKMREQFRPFAASVLQDKVHELFEVPENNHNSPFMNFVFQVKPEAKQKIAAIVHADNTCRIQTINKQDNLLYYKLIHRFYELTDIPCLLNTSFNTKIEPIVESPEQALYDLLHTKLDYLAIGKYLVKKPTRTG